MATEAEHLITVSLGKFASSRNQRGGINLHKNLLVANVLFKARAVFVMEKYSKLAQSEQLGDYRPATDTDSIVQEEEINETNNSIQRIDSVDNKTENFVESSGQSHSDSDNDGCISTTTVLSRSCDSNERSCDSSGDQKSHTAEQEVTSFTSLETPKATSSAIKRKHSQDDDDEVFTTTNSHSTVPLLTEVVECSSPTKLARYDYTCSKTVNSTTTYTDSSTNTEPMQTDSSQITELANSFSLSFTGLLKTGRAENISCSKECSHNIYTNTSYSSPAASTTESLISCSTQIKEALETLTLPIIALHAC